MSFLDTFSDLNRRMFAPGGVVGQAPSDPIVTKANQERWLDAGRDVLEDAARSARLWDALRESRTDPSQRRRILAVLAGVRAQEAAAGLTRLLADGASTLAAWYRSMRDDLLPRYHAAGMAILGRLDPTPATLGVLRDESNRQMGFLARFRDNLRTARQLLDGTAEARARLYVAAAWPLGMTVEHQQMILDGYTKYRSVLGAVDSCRGCLDRASRRWQPIGTLLPIGEAECLSRCRCHFEYR